MIDVDIRLALGSFVLDAQFRSAAPVSALFGRSGAGKSTIVKAVGGLLTPQSGRIALGDTVIFDSARGIDVPARARRIGHVFQDARLFPHMTVAVNLGYGGRYAAKKPSAETWDEVVKLLDIGPLLDRYPAGLSGGEIQRVAIGRALLMSPLALIMDEPLASLDGRRKAEILPYLDRLTAEAHVPILYVSHALDEVMRLASTLVLVEDGHVLASGPVEEVMARADLADATGGEDAGAVLAARIAGHNEAYMLTEIDVAGQMVTVPRVAAEPGHAMRLLIRAGDVVLATSRPEGLSARNVLSGRIEAIAVGAGAYADVAVDIGGANLRARITRQALDDLDLKTGDAVFALIKSVAIGRRVPWSDM